MIFQRNQESQPFNDSMLFAGGTRDRLWKMI